MSRTPSLEILARLQRYRHTCESLTELVGSEFPSSNRGVYDFNPIWRPPFHHYEMVEIPMHYRWKAHSFELIGLHRECFDLKAVAPRDSSDSQGCVTISTYT
jgi:hypothetical protein